MIDLPKQIADIQRRLRALKAKRNIDISQFNVLYREWDYSLSLTPSPTAGYVARWEITIPCGGDPIVSVGVDGLPYGDSKVEARTINSISGDTAVMEVNVRNNDTVSGRTFDVTVKCWALNGLTASIVRTL